MLMRADLITFQNFVACRPTEQTTKFRTDQPIHLKFGQRRSQISYKHNKLSILESVYIITESLPPLHSRSTESSAGTTYSNFSAVCHLENMFIMEQLAEIYVFFRKKDKTNCVFLFIMEGILMY